MDKPAPFPAVGPGGDKPFLTPNGVAKSTGNYPETGDMIAQPRLLNGQYTYRGWQGNRTGE